MEEEEDREEIHPEAEAVAGDRSQLDPAVTASARAAGTNNSIRLVNRATALPAQNAEHE